MLTLAQCKFPNKEAYCVKWQEKGEKKNWISNIYIYILGNKYTHKFNMQVCIESIIPY